MNKISFNIIFISSLITWNNGIIASQSTTDLLTTFTSRIEKMESAINEIKKNQDTNKYDAVVSQVNATIGSIQRDIESIKQRYGNDQQASNAQFENLGQKIKSLEDKTSKDQPLSDLANKIVQVESKINSLQQAQPAKSEKEITDQLRAYVDELDKKRSVQQAAPETTSELKRLSQQINNFESKLTILDNKLEKKVSGAAIETSTAIAPSIPPAPELTQVSSQLSAKKVESEQKKESKPNLTLLEEIRQGKKLKQAKQNISGQQIEAKDSTADEALKAKLRKNRELIAAEDSDDSDNEDWT